MKSIIIALMIVAVPAGFVLACGGAGGCSCKGSCGNSCSDGAMTPLVQGTEVGNTLCPISGQTVGSMGKASKYAYEGKVYNLCCDMCTAEFQKDPQKYSEIAQRKVL